MTPTLDSLPPAPANDDDRWDIDNARDLDKAVGRLARAGFEDTVYDEAIVAEEPSNAGLVVFAPGYAPAMVWGVAEPTLKPNLASMPLSRPLKLILPIITCRTR